MEIENTLYYNPQTKEIKEFQDLKNALNSCIPDGTKKVFDWYLLINEYPEYDDVNQKLIKDKIIKRNDEYIQTYNVLDVESEFVDTTDISVKKLKGLDLI